MTPERESLWGQQGRRGSFRAIVLGAALWAGYLGVTGCDYNQYPIEASFCDDWCRTMRRTGCEQEPENCVRDCESALPSDRCLPLQSSLLACYQGVAADQFECVGGGFQATVRPRPEICRLERDELIACEVPPVKECIDVCRELDASNPFASGDAGAASSEGGGGAACPDGPVPCERLCWELDARFGRGVAERGMRVTATSSVDLAALGEPYVRCAQERAQSCRDGVVAEGLAGAARVSWTRLFLECAGLSLDLDLFD